MGQFVIRVERLGKRYRVGSRTAAYDTLRESLVSALGRPFKRFRLNGHGSAYPSPLAASPLPLAAYPSPPAASPASIWALKDVSFEVKRGEVVGIIGPNGAGKSTLLKVLSRITEPTTGAVDIYGRVGSLLEVGTGFHPELTGRENVFLNGAILGMRKAEIARKFDEIVAFAEIEKFIDTPVKHYSSGMHVRLAFAVAAHLEPEILLVDEVLAVGDAQFQNKCLGKIGDVAREGRTVLFVSHNMQAVQHLCRQGLVLKAGSLVTRGDITSCISTYLSDVSHAPKRVWTNNGSPDGRQPLSIQRVECELVTERPDLLLRVLMALRTFSIHKPAFVAIDISDSLGTVMMQALPSLAGFISSDTVEHEVEVDIDLPPLVPGTYFVTVWVGSHNTETLDQVSKAVSFEVTTSPTTGRTFPHTPDHGLIVPRSRFIHRSIRATQTAIL